MPAAPIDRSRPPLPAPPRSFRLPEVESRRLPNGLEIVVAADHSVPLVSATLLLRSGSTSDPEGQAGLASLAAALLTEGAGGLDAAEYARRADRLGASISAGAGFDSTVVHLSCLARHFAAGLELMAAAALEPAFDEREVARVRGMRLDSLRQRRDSPAHLAAERFDAVVYVGTPYSRPPAGDEESVGTIAPSDLRQLHARVYRPGGSVLVLAGDLDPSTAADEAARILGGWAPGTPPASPSVEARPIDATRIVLVDRPASVQSAIRIGQASVPRNHPDFFVLLVLNSILGGKFTSRVNLNLRERNGYTYGASTRFEHRLSGGPFVAAADVENGVTAPSVRELVSEIRRIRETEVEPEELADAVGWLQGVFPYMLETADDLASRLVEMRLHRLPDDHLAGWTGALGRVTRADLLRAAREHLDPERLAIVVVGKADEVSAPLRELAPLEIVDVDGRPRP